MTAQAQDRAPVSPRPGARRRRLLLLGYLVLLLASAADRRAAVLDRTGGTPPPAGGPAPVTGLPSTGAMIADMLRHD